MPRPNAYYSDENSPRKVDLEDEQAEHDTFWIGLCSRLGCPVCGGPEIEEE